MKEMLSIVAVILLSFAGLTVVQILSPFFSGGTPQLIELECPVCADRTQYLEPDAYTWTCRSCNRQHWVKR